MLSGSNYSRTVRLKPTKLPFDEPFHQAGYHYLCGIDEAGRGALAGPVVAAALIFKPGVVIDGLNDSKCLTPQQRDFLEPQIKAAALGYGIGLAEADQIDRINIQQATFLAMKRALEQLNMEPQFILVDGRDFPTFISVKSDQAMPGQAVIKGDQRSACIAAASVLAKVYRDRLMIGLAARYPQYGLEQHKGYGTREHRERIADYGPSPIHRRSFLQAIMEKMWV